MARIMIADDDPSTRRILELTLSWGNHEIYGVEDGRAALALIKTLEVDLAIIDLLMPELDGLDLLRALRRDPRYAGLPVIVLTGSSSSQDQADAALEGIDAFLTKPTDSTELLDLVKALLAR